MASIIHPRMFDQLKAFYPETCTIQECTEVQDAAGQPVKTWSNRVGYVDIACRVSPNGGGERKGNQVYLVASHVIELTGCYPDIITKNRAVVNNQDYDILLVESDGQSTSTKLVCQVVR